MKWEICLFSFTGGCDWQLTWRTITSCIHSTSLRCRSSCYRNRFVFEYCFISRKYLRKEIQRFVNEWFDVSYRFLLSIYILSVCLFVIMPIERCVTLSRKRSEGLLQISCSPLPAKQECLLMRTRYFITNKLIHRVIQERIFSLYRYVKSWNIHQFQWKW